MNKLIIYLIIFIFIILFFFISKILYFKNDVINTDYILTGTVIHGFGYANKIFDYPTANLSVNHDLPCGLYTAISNYGECICFITSRDNIEFHIKKFNKDIYNKKVKLTNFIEIHDINSTSVIISNLSYLLKKQCNNYNRIL